MFVVELIVFVIFIFLYYSISIVKLVNFKASKQSVDITSSETDHSRKQLVRLILQAICSFNSIIVFIGLVSETYFFGAFVLGNSFGISIAFFICAIFILPVVKNLDPSISSPFEYLQKRYSDKVYIRVISSLAGLVFYFTFMTLYLTGSAVILGSLVPELPDWSPELIIGFVLLIGGLLGGYQQFLTVILIQMALIIIGLLVASIITLVSETNVNNSLSDIWNVAANFEKAKFVKTEINFATRYTIWNQMFSLPLPWCVMHLFTLKNFKQIRQMKNIKTGRMVLLFSIPVVILANFIPVISGIMCFIFFIDIYPFKLDTLKNKNQIATYWIIFTLGETVPWLTGVVFASLIANSLIQHSTGMNACANVIINDQIKPIFRIRNSTFKYENRLRIFLVVFLEISSIALSRLINYLGNSLISLFYWINNAINAPFFGLLLLAFFNPYSNHFGASISFVLCLGITSWLAIGSIMYNRADNIKNARTFLNLNKTFVHTVNLSRFEPQPTEHIIYQSYSIATIW